MKPLILIFLIVLIANPVFAENNGDFLDEFSSPVQITPIGKVLPVQYDKLTTQDKENLLSAKSVLIEFIKSFDIRSQKSLDYLHQPLKDKYEDDIDLFRKEFDNPESILKLKIVNFLLKREGNKEVVLYTSLLTTSEGIDTFLHRSYALQKFNSEWKITRLSDSIKYWSVEIDS